MASQEPLRIHPVAGVAFDITFRPAVWDWPLDDARPRQGPEEPPTIVDWQDVGWWCGQATGERWLEEFGASVADAVREVGADLTVNHEP